MMRITQEQVQSIREGKAAVITDIQRFKAHDGPGIRTMLFFKGCPLRCKWCQNPETWHREPELMYFPNLCLGDRQCVKTCPSGSLSIGETGLQMDSSKCLRCGKCTNVCYAEALKVTGRYISLEEAKKRILDDEVFFKVSGGGVTLSGGECTMFPKFIGNLLGAAKEHKIHTAIETCGFWSWNSMKDVVPLIDLFLYDIKVPFGEKSRKYTGQDSELILQNLERLRDMGKRVILRMPFIPGVNTDDETLHAVGEIAKRNRIEELHILPFHQVGSNKWHALRRQYDCESWRIPTEEETQNAKTILQDYIPYVSIGGQEYHEES